MDTQRAWTAYKLRNAIMEMADRYAASLHDWSVTGQNYGAVRRRSKALARLTDALARRAGAAF